MTYHSTDKHTYWGKIHTEGAACAQASTPGNTQQAMPQVRTLVKTYLHKFG